MQSHGEKNSSELISKTILLLFAVGLNGLELIFPRIPFLPWFKPGLANTITIIWLIRYGMSDALLFTILRSWISGFYFGFSLLTLSLSLSGGLLSTLAMGLFWHMFGKKGALGTIGLGVLGAFIHNCGQLIAVYFLLTKNYSVFYQVPFMIIAALLFGSITGLLVPTISKIISAGIMPNSYNLAASNKTLSFGKKDLFISAIIIILCFSLFMINSIPILLALTLAITFLAYLTSFKKHNAFLYPLRFKYLFLFITITYILFSPGKRITPLPFPTDEGLISAIIQLLRIWSWIEAGLILQAFQFNTILFSMLSRLFPKHKTTLSSGIMALEYFPEVISIGHKKGKIGWIMLIQKPAEWIKLYLFELSQKIEIKLLQYKNI